MTDELINLLNELQVEHEACIQAQRSLVAGPAYQAQTKFIDRMTSDFLMTLIYA